MLKLAATPLEAPSGTLMFGYLVQFSTIPIHVAFKSLRYLAMLRWGKKALYNTMHVA